MLHFAIFGYVAARAFEGTALAVILRFAIVILFIFASFCSCVVMVLVCRVVACTPHVCL